MFDPAVDSPPVTEVSKQLNDTHIVSFGVQPPKHPGRPIGGCVVDKQVYELGFATQSMAYGIQFTDEQRDIFFFIEYRQNYLNGWHKAHLFSAATIRDVPNG